MLVILMFKDWVFLCYVLLIDDVVFWLDMIMLDGGVCFNMILVIEGVVMGIDVEFILCGYSYILRVVCLRDGCWVVNVGSVGLLGYDGRLFVSYVVEVGMFYVCYVILECIWVGWFVMFCYVLYDSALMVVLVCSKGMLGWVDVIVIGWVF